VAGGDYEGHPFCRPNCPVITAARKGQPSPNYDVLARPPGAPSVWLNVSILVLEVADHEEPITVHLVRDVSKRRKAEILAEETILAVSRFAPAAPGPARSLSPFPAPPAALTPREVEVLRMLAAGVSVREVAEQLVVSQVTVRNHIENLMGKLGVHTRLQAVVYAAQHGLI
jgi:DNA-binding NarL/FixJ family response regulator